VGIKQTILASRFKNSKMGIKEVQKVETQPKESISISTENKK
jgi:hypothetical protein